MGIKYRWFFQNLYTYISLGDDLLNGTKRLIAKGVIPRKLEKKINPRSRKKTSLPKKNNSHSHPRHKNGRDVEHGKCPRCIAVNGEKETPVTEIEEHHVIPVCYGGKHGPKRKGCPDCHVGVHFLYERFVMILVMQNLPAFVEISDRHFAGEALTDGDLTKIALKSLKEGGDISG